MAAEILYAPLKKNKLYTTWTEKTKKAMRAIEMKMNGERADAHEFSIGGI